MAEPQFRVYVAVSLDGFIATTDGGVDWLKPFEEDDVGYEEFIAKIGTIVIGRTTYDQIRSWGEWPYPGKQVSILSSRPVPNPVEGAVLRDGDYGSLADEIAKNAGRDIWVLGGAITIQGFLDAGRIDEVELFFVPVVLGRGIRLLDDARPHNGWQLTAAEPYPNGLARLSYRIAD